MFLTPKFTGAIVNRPKGSINYSSKVLPCPSQPTQSAHTVMFLYRSGMSNPLPVMRTLLGAVTYI